MAQGFIRINGESGEILKIPVHVDLLFVHMDLLSIHMDLLSIHMDLLSIHMDLLSIHMDLLSIHMDFLFVHMDQVSIHIAEDLIHVAQGFINQVNGLAQRQRRGRRDTLPIMAHSGKSRLRASGAAAVRLEPVLGCQFSCHLEKKQQMRLGNR